VCVRLLGEVIHTERLAQGKCTMWLSSSSCVKSGNSFASSPPCREDSRQPELFTHKYTHAQTHTHTHAHTLTYHAQHLSLNLFLSLLSTQALTKQHTV
jgi:hypothetical protein